MQVGGSLLKLIEVTQKEQRPNSHVLQVVKGGTMSRMRWTKIRTFQTLDGLDLRD